MPDQNFACSVEQHDKNSKILTITITAVGIIATLILSAMELNVMTVSGNPMSLTFAHVPIIVLSGLCGQIPGLIAVLTVFIHHAFADIDYSFYVFIYLMLCIGVSYIFKKKWYKDKKRYICCMLATIFLLGDVWGFFTYVLENYHLPALNLHIILALFFCCLPETVLAFGTLYFIYRKSPDRIRSYFPTTSAYARHLSVMKQIHKSRLSFRLFVVLTFQAAILCIAASIFANFLIDDIGHVVMRRSYDRFRNIQESQRADDDDDDGDENKNDEDEGEDLVSEIEGFWDMAEIGEGPINPQSRNGLQKPTIRINRAVRFDPNAEPIKIEIRKTSLIFDLKLVLMLLTLVIPVGSLVNVYAQYFIAHPINSMSEAMGAFAVDDEKSILIMAENAKRIHNLKIQTNDEIEELYHAMDKMASDTVEYLHFMEKEKQLEADLQVAKAASESKSAFLSNMSHEIRTPINAVMGMNEMILREYDDPQLLEYSTNIENASKTLLSLVNDILDFSKIEAGKMEIIPVEYELSSVINDLVNMVRTKAEDKGLELKINVDKSAPHLLYGDDVRIKQCATNVLTNAVKYTNEGSVTLNINFEKISDDEIALTFQVIDTGIGIKEEDLSKLYSPFERIEEVRNRTIEGTGLGMSITRKLLAMMDTKLIVRSVYGEGSDFAFTLKQKVVKWDPIGDFAETYRQTVQNAKKYTESFHAPDAKVLVVDDTTMNLTVIKGLLKSTQIQVETATSGKETLELVQNNHYDCIFLDHRMPEMDGIETLAAMKKLENSKCEGVPCVALTANAVSGAREEYLKAGFDDYLTKPVDSAKIEQLLIRYLPKEKVIRSDEPSFDSAVRTLKSGKSEGEENKEASFMKQIAGIKGIDTEAALANCGGEELLQEVMKDFLSAISSKAESIERYWHDKDYKNYTILVHALKSSARVIGALDLSEDAKYMEEMGNLIEAGALTEDGRDPAEVIDEKTQKLLSDYRNYEEKLSFLNPNYGAGKDERPLIDYGELQDAFDALRETVDAFDFDSADSIIAMLEEYRMPAEVEEKYRKIKELVTAVDHDGLMQVLSA